MGRGILHAAFTSLKKGILKLNFIGGPKCGKDKTTYLLETRLNSYKHFSNFSNGKCSKTSAHKITSN